jgi:putative membrane protein
VVCVDRDDDIGRKTQIKGPIIGRKANLVAARELALADPAESDVNAIYGAIKLADELDVEVVTLTGDKRVGVISDKEIAKQLDEIIMKLNPTSVYFVSDGLDDEQVMPIIQSRVKIDSVLTITVRQSKELEKAYFKLANFIKEVTGDPALARLIFGLPGIALLLLSLGGAKALTWIMAIVGLYLIIKGFGLEEDFFNTTTEFLKSLSVERVSTILYVIAFMTLALAMVNGYNDLQRSALSFKDPSTTFNTIGLFILNSSSVNLVMLCAVIVIAARVIDEWSLKKFIKVKKHFILAGFIVLLAIVLDAGANVMINESYGFDQFLLYGFASIVTLAIWIRLTEYIFKADIQMIEDILKATEQKEVVGSEGQKIGTVTKAVVEHLKLKELRIGHRIISAAQVESVGDVIIMKKGVASVSGAGKSK